MLRIVIGIIVGLVVGIAVVAIMESIGHAIFPPPEGMDLKDPDAIKEMMAEISIGAKVAVLVAWGLGVFVGGVVARMISVGAAPAAWTVAGVLFAGAIVSMVMIPHPLWMVIGAVVVTLLGVFAANKATPLRRA